MTRKKDLKKRVRERMRRTGERYTTALARVRDEAEPEPSSIVLELFDVSQRAAAAGCTCAVRLSPGVTTLLPDGGDIDALLARLVALLRATAGDADTAALRAIVLEGGGERTVPWGPRLGGSALQGIKEYLAVSLRHIERLEAGLRGVRADGLALPFDLVRDGARLALCATVFPVRTTGVLIETIDELIARGPSLRESLDSLEAGDLFRSLALVVPRVAGGD